MKIKPIKKWWWILYRQLFPKADFNNVFIAFNHTIYTNREIPMDILVHESLHFEQQGGFVGSLKWWIKYIFNNKFRYSQELPAYQAQINYIVNTQKDKNTSWKLKAELQKEFARIMSNPMYNNMVSYDKALYDLQ